MAAPERDVHAAARVNARKQLSIREGTMRTTFGGAALVTGALVLASVSGGLPAQADSAAAVRATAASVNTGASAAQVSRCDRSNDAKKYALPHKSDIVVKIDHCITKRKSGSGYKLSSSLTMLWDELSEHFGSMYRFNHFYVYLYVNKRNNGGGGDKNLKRTMCDFTDALNARRESAIGCYTPPVNYSKKYDYYSDVFVVADVASDGKGEIYWALDRSKYIY
ncbi:hypothetical protein [Nonomuraea sp. NPDC049695]|uniref:hypothetical protein n=1 Tax=Nonomuraea sp. NPDC049695 TaxID=3154734 RepID=UPI00342D859B